jgi:hypothetical protein
MPAICGGSFGAPVLPSFRDDSLCERQQRHSHAPVDAASPNDSILVTNGLYKTGTTLMGSLNRVVITKSVTVQSVNGPGVTMIVGDQMPGTTNGDKAVRCVYLSNGAVLSGFTLTNGATGTISGNYGGGVYFEVGSGGVVSNCILVGNSAASLGGGAYLGPGALNNCTLSGNYAPNGGGAVGGALNNCTLSGNSAINGGGAYACRLNYCTVAFNSAISAGGGTYSGTLTGSLIVSNQVNSTSAGQGNGGGINGSRAGNCTIVGNQAGCSGTGGGLGGGVFLGMLQNCVVFFNTAKSYSNYYGRTLTNSCTVPAALGTGNITNEPRFINLSAGNLRLQSNSPCINSGNNTSVTSSTDLDANPRIKGGTVDIGAYEYQTPSSVLSYAWAQQYGLPTDGTADYADTDGDGMNNWQEWRTGTNPNDAAFLLKMLAPTNDISGTTITWQSVYGMTYFLQRSSNFVAEPSFSTIQTNLAGQIGTTTYTDTTAVGPGPFFYRVGVQ